jgi:hypothetical protein
MLFMLLVPGLQSRPSRMNYKYLRFTFEPDDAGLPIVARGSGNHYLVVSLRKQ